MPAVCQPARCEPSWHRHSRRRRTEAVGLRTCRQAFLPRHELTDLNPWKISFCADSFLITAIAGCFGLRLGAAGAWLSGRRRPHFLLTEFRPQHIDRANLRRLAEQLRRVGHQRLRDRAVEMGLAALL